MRTNFDETTASGASHAKRPSRAEGDWKRELREVSAASYCITLLDPTGHIRYSASGSDPDALVEDAKQWLSDIGAQARAIEALTHRRSNPG